jgi:hypothetical protein
MLRVYTWSGIQTPGMPKEWSRSEPQTSITLRDSTRSRRKTSKFFHLNKK